MPSLFTGLLVVSLVPNWIVIRLAKAKNNAPLQVLLVLMSLIGVFLSLRAYRRQATTFQSETPKAGAPHEQLALIGILYGSLFAVIILMQGLASFFLTGCEP
jgi:hypothetical protein